MFFMAVYLNWRIMKKDKKIDAKQSELAKQIGFAELVSELGDAVDRYYPEALFLRAKTI